MNETDLARLRGDIHLAFWRDIEPHAKRGAVFIVGPHLSIEEVGVALADNAVTKVEGWIQSAALARPSIDQLAKWNGAPGTVLEMLIVTPFVLAKETELPAAAEQDVNHDVTWNDIIGFVKGRQNSS